MYQMVRINEFYRTHNEAQHRDTPSQTDLTTMNLANPLAFACALAPIGCMTIAALSALVGARSPTAQWKRFALLAQLGLVAAISAVAMEFLSPLAVPLQLSRWITVEPLGACVALLVQLLATVIGLFSSRYLVGEHGQQRYIVALATVVASVHLLLLANHWLVMIVSWSLAGSALRRLLCFYRDRPFAMLAAHKKRVADALADVLLLGAAALAWSTVGSGSFSDLWLYVARDGMTLPLQICASCLALAAILRTALLPMHGWLIQVMEAPTPVSALLHAGVVNLGGYVLIRFAPLLSHAPAAGWLLVALGLGTTLLAGLVLLTRTSIKVRLAWSTVAQMGFMLLECGLGLYMMAAFHLVGHSLYKATAFLSASEIVRESKLKTMRGHAAFSRTSLTVAPALSASSIAAVHFFVGSIPWPWWWSGVLALAWAPLFWQPAPERAGATPALTRAIVGWSIAACLTAITTIGHAVPLRVLDAPNDIAGDVALAGLALLYLSLVALQVCPEKLASWRRWSYAGFYIDEFATRLALHVGPTWWPSSSREASRRNATNRTMVAVAAE